MADAEMAGEFADVGASLGTRVAVAAGTPGFAEGGSGEEVDGGVAQERGDADGIADVGVEALEDELESRQVAKGNELEAVSRKACPGRSAPGTTEDGASGEAAGRAAPGRDDSADLGVDGGGC